MQNFYDNPFWEKSKWSGEREREIERKRKNAIKSGHLVLWQCMQAARTNWDQLCSYLYQGKVLVEGTALSIEPATLPHVAGHGELGMRGADVNVTEPTVKLSSSHTPNKVIVVGISTHADGGPRSAHAWPFARPPISMSRSHTQSFGILGQLLKIPPFVRPSIA